MLDFNHTLHIHPLLFLVVVDVVDVVVDVDVDVVVATVAILLVLPLLSLYCFAFFLFLFRFLLSRKSPLDDDGLIQPSNMGGSMAGFDQFDESHRVLQHTPKQTALVRLAVADSSRTREPLSTIVPSLSSLPTSLGGGSSHLPSSLSSSSSSSSSSLLSSSSSSSSPSHNSFVKPLPMSAASRGITQDYASPSVQRRSIVGSTRAGGSTHAAAAAAATASHAASARATGGQAAAAAAAAAAASGSTGLSSSTNFIGGSSGGSGESSDEGVQGSGSSTNANNAPLRLKPRPKSSYDNPSSTGGAAAGPTSAGSGSTSGSGSGSAAGAAVAAGAGSGMMMMSGINDPLAQPRGSGPLGLSRGGAGGSGMSDVISSSSSSSSSSTSSSSSSSSSSPSVPMNVAQPLSGERLTKTHATQDYSSPRVTSRSMKLPDGAGSSSRARSFAADDVPSLGAGSGSSVASSHTTSTWSHTTSHMPSSGMNSSTVSTTPVSSSTVSGSGSSVSLLEGEGSASDPSDPETVRSAASHPGAAAGAGGMNGTSPTELGLAAARGNSAPDFSSYSAPSMTTAEFVARSPAQINTQSKLLQLAGGQRSENLLGTPKPSYLKRLDSPDVRGGELIAKRKQLTHVLQQALTYVPVVDLNAFSLVKSQLQEALEALEAGCVDPHRVDAGIGGAAAESAEIVK